MVMMQVSGDSMEPGIRAGDTVMIDRSRTAVVAGGIYAVGIDDTIMIKRLEKGCKSRLLEKMRKS
jgi:phage repressor protein C with HTH and peptisase S24 domain